MKRLFQLGPQHHGHGPVTFAWQPNGHYVASVGEGQRTLFLFDRRGSQVDEVQLRSTSNVLQLQWDKDGEVLAILQAGDDHVQLWRQADKRLETLELHSKDPSWLAWSKLGPQLVVGTCRGNVTIFNRMTMKKQAIVGKHSKKITCGAWHPQENIFACGAEDRSVTLNDEEGEPLSNQGEEALRLKNEPLSIQFPAVKAGDSYGGDRPVAVLNGDTSVLLFHVRDNSKPTDLSFQQHYGTIMDFCWFSDQYLIIGFSHGFVVAVSSQMRDGVEETSSAKYHPNTLFCVCCSKAANKIASAGDDGVRIISALQGGRPHFKEVASERIQVKPDAKVTSMHWSEDGELLSFSTEAGHIYCYLAKLTVLSATCNSRLAYLTSLQELTICDCADEAAGKQILKADVEPGLVALGPSHVATAFNNRCWYYSCPRQPSLHSANQLVNEQEYVSNVEAVSLNATHACVLIGGRVFLHPIEGGDKTTIFPRKGGDGTITCASIVAGFLIYAQSNGRLQYYSLADSTEVNEYKHATGIRKCFPNQEGTRCIIVDVSGAAFLYNPVNDDCASIREFPSGAEKVLWDSLDSSVFAASSGSLIHSFMYTQSEVGGSGVRCLGNADIGPEGDLRVEKMPTEMGQGQSLLLLVDGNVWCQQANGALSQMRLRSHDLVCGPQLATETTERLRAGFKQALSLNRFQLVFKIGLSLNQKELWIAMGRRCLECLDLGWAKKAYRQAPQPGMVLYLERIQTIEDKKLLSGHVDSLLGRFGKAREHFLQSICPEAALDMHCDFLEWDKAISLAQTLAQHRLPAIFLRSAMQLEAKEEFQQALTHFEQASSGGGDPYNLDHDSLCQAGIARTSVRLGDLARGIEVAKELGDPAVCKDCAVALERMRQFSEAAEMYVEAHAFDLAASLYIQEFNFDAAAPLMSKIHTPKIHLAFAKAKEARGSYSEARVAYERARDMDSVVRLSLENLNEAARAFQLVRDTGLASGAERVADYCVKKGDIPGAIEFLLMAKMDERAFQLAERHDAMSAYEEGLGEQGEREQHAAVARYYEQRSLNSEAAKHYTLCGEYHVALKLYLKVGEREIDKAIEVVGKARNDALTHQLVDYLMGDSDHVPKAPVHICKLHKVLGNHLQAASAGLMIARQEQEVGNYKQAHEMLRNSYQDLRGQKFALPQELWRRLMVLHSYVIVKRLVKGGDHAAAARMLLRVAKNIQEFPAHVVPILTSTVIECQRAKMGGEAYKYACELMKPDNRAQISEQYKKKIENIVRKPKPEDQEEGQEGLTNCMHCGFSLPDSQLDCPNCQNISPFCIVTGMRMLKDDWARCPSCHFPARRSAFMTMLQNGDACPMCDAAVKPADVPVISDSGPHIAEYKSIFQPESKESKDA